MTRPPPNAESLGLTAQLEQALLRALLGSWKQLNGTFFSNALRAPVFELISSQSRLGQWHSQTRTMSLARVLVLHRPWGDVVEVLKHEMAHQYVHEVLRELDETAHGKAFRSLCHRIGIDPTASGPPLVQPEAEEERVIGRVARLLALAESPNRHEAEAAMAAAQRLMLKHNIDECQTPNQRQYGFRHLGVPTGRVSEHERILAMILNTHFFVEVIWVPVYRPAEGKTGSVLEVCGTCANLEMAAYVHSFLSHTAERLWDEHRRSHEIRRNRDRRVFLAGVMTGFYEKLQSEASSHQKQGLVWIKDVALQGFYRRRHPYIRNARYQGHAKTEAYSYGKQAGREIVIHRPVQAASSSTGRLLGPAMRRQSS